MKIKKIYILIGIYMQVFWAVDAYSADYLEEGHEAFLNYDFELASELYAKYAKALDKRPDPDGENLLEKYERQLQIAESSLENVQKLEIIDRIDVPAGDYVSGIPLPANEGRLLPPGNLPIPDHYNDSDYTFNSSSGDFVMWTETGEEGISKLYESTRLIDGSWETPISSGTVLNDGGNLRNPFMLTDGMTLYFAGDGDGSMGGLDLFVATKDPSTGKYRQPTGLGYPFNSPYNEYMIAIDEENGIGWWVTDRNQLDGKVSVYVFYTNDVRKNYNPDEEEDIVALARIDDIKITQNPEKDYAMVISDIKERGNKQVLTDTNEIKFPFPGGRMIKHLSDLKSAAAKRSLSKYLNAESEFIENCEQLSSLRKKYHSEGRVASQALKNQIYDLEKAIERQRDKLKKMRNAVILAEN
ncbi:MAG: hypothetical protein NC095_08705 [Muribaculum sp.]|nr:hypothetical protein [Muribaculum sp.]